MISISPAYSSNKTSKTVEFKKLIIVTLLPDDPEQIRELVIGRVGATQIDRRVATPRVLRTKLFCAPQKSSGRSHWRRPVTKVTSHTTLTCRLLPPTGINPVRTLSERCIHIKKIKENK